MWFVLPDHSIIYEIEFIRVNNCIKNDVLFYQCRFSMSHSTFKATSAGVYVCLCLFYIPFDNINLQYLRLICKIETEDNHISSSSYNFPYWQRSTLKSTRLQGVKVCITFYYCMTEY